MSLLLLHLEEQLNQELLANTELLAQQKASFLNTLDGRGYTALMYAAEMGRYCFFITVAYVRTYIHPII